MLNKIEHQKRGKGNYNWLKAIYHFSFANYYNPNNMNFGVLKVLNDDIIGPKTGFDLHPHRNMEIITYIVDGELTHQDSMGNKKVLNRGHIQYMSAGTGVYHSEENASDDYLRSLQIWIEPDKNGYEPIYGDYRFPFNERENKWLHMVSGMDGKAPVKIHQDVNLYSLYLIQNHEIEFIIHPNRQAYLVQIEGTSIINEIKLKEKDALEIDETIQIQASQDSHFILIEMSQ